VVSHLLELVDEADRNRDGKIDFDEWQIMSSFSFSKIPIALSDAPPKKKQQRESSNKSPWPRTNFHK
jgi:hypothetical protein